MKPSVCLSLAFLVSPMASVSAQGDPPPASTDVLEALSLTTATVQSISVPLSAEQSAEVDVQLGQQSVVLDLQPFDIRSPDFEVWERTATGEVQLEAGPPVTMRGLVRTHPDSSVAVTLIGGGLEAMVLLGSEQWWITPAANVDPGAGADQHVVFRQSDIVGLNVSCGNEEGSADQSVPPRASRNHVPFERTGYSNFPRERASRNSAFREQPGGNILVADVIIEVDKAFFEHPRLGNNNRMQATDKAMMQINNVSMMYEAQLGIGYFVTAVFVQTEIEQYTAMPQQTLLHLNQLTSYWNTVHVGRPRDLVHLLSGKGTFTGNLGRAWFGVVCDPSSGYAVSRVVSRNPALNWAVIAHEFGHNWNANHCDGEADCDIMNSMIMLNGGMAPSTFGQTSVNAITSYLTTPPLPCLTPGALASYEFFGAGCVGSNGLAPQLANPTLPLAGEDFRLTVTQCPANANVIFFIGRSNTNWGAFSLPLDMTSFGMPSCFLLTSTDMTITATTGLSGQVSMLKSIPNDPSVLGYCFYNQAYVADPGANQRGFTLSNAGAGVIGYR